MDFADFTFEIKHKLMQSINWFIASSVDSDFMECKCTYSKCYDLPGESSQAVLSKTASGEILTNFYLAFNMSGGSFCFAEDLTAFATMKDFSWVYNIVMLWKKDE